MKKSKNTVKKLSKCSQTISGEHIFMSWGVHDSCWKRGGVSFAVLKCVACEKFK